MEDSIINLDECDPFSLSSDTDIRNIVDQWKRNDSDTGNRAVPDSKYFDTRTFTRPKKKSFSGAELNGELVERPRLQPSREFEAMGGAAPKIDLQIGGLVTSSSFLGDCSPPPHMDASITNSLITSSDFSNVNDFFNGADDSLSMTHFKQYRLADAINDRNFLERLSNYDASLFTKDNDINDIDANQLIEAGNSSSSTLQNSTDSSTNQSRHDDTFTAVNNGTFEADAGVDRTFIHVDAELNDTPRNRTFECDAVAGKPNGNNGTFEAKPNDQTRSNLWNQTVDLIDDEELSLCGTFSFNDFRVPQPAAPVSAAVEKATPKGLLAGPTGLNGLESTPARQRAKKSRDSTSLVNISPIVPATPQTVDKFVDIEIEDEVPRLLMRSKEPSSAAVNGSSRHADMERQSLANFEEFEKSLLILENQNEEEFDDLLNSFSPNIRNPLSDKVRQSLDNIKKRHSMIGVEKQQEDELSREKTPKGRLLGGDRNRTAMDAQSPAMVSSTSSVGSGTGERLLRRSRVFDDGLSITSTPNDNKDADYLSAGAVVPADDLNTTEALNQRNRSHLDNDPNQKTEDTESAYNADGTPSKGNRTTKNRDRFKTIRIFKRPSDDAAQLPDADETFVQAADVVLETHAVPMKIAPEVFASRNRNSPLKASYENVSADAKAINTMTFKRSALARPKQLLHGLQKRDLYAKSSSHEMLATDETLESTFTQAKAVSQLKSPMGFKSKSVHNLLGAKNAHHNGSFQQASIATTQPSTSTNTFKMPTARAIPAMRQKTSVGPVQQRGLVRPSSGYYGYASRRTDSDSESGRFSSTTSLSSGSSKSSLSRGETPETQSASPNDVLNSTFTQAPNVAMGRPSVSVASKLAPPRLSLLRPPTQIRRSGLPRPSAAPAKR